MAVEEQFYVVVNFDDVRFMISVSASCTVEELRSEIENIAGKEYPHLREKKVAVIQNSVRADLHDRFIVKEILQGKNEIFVFPSVDSAKSSRASVNSLTCASTPSVIKRHRDSIDTEINLKCGNTLKSSEVETKPILDKSSDSLKKKEKIKEILKVLRKELVNDSASDTEELTSAKSSVSNCGVKVKQSSEIRNNSETNVEVKDYQVENSPKDKVEDTSLYCNTKKGKRKRARTSQEIDNTLNFPTPPISPEMSSLPLVAPADYQIMTGKENGSKWVKYYRSAKNVVTWLANQEDHLSKESQEKEGNCNTRSDLIGGQEENVRTGFLLSDKCLQKGEVDQSSQQSHNNNSTGHQESNKDEIDEITLFPVIDFNRNKVIFFDGRHKDGMLFKKVLKLPQIALSKLNVHEEYEGDSLYVYVSTDEPTEKSKGAADSTKGKNEDDDDTLEIANLQVTGAKLKKKTKSLMQVVNSLHLQKKAKVSCNESMNDGMISVDTQEKEIHLERDSIEERKCSLDQKAEGLETTTVEDRILSTEPATFLSESQNKENDSAHFREGCGEIGSASGKLKKKEKTQKKRKGKLKMEQLVLLGKEDEPEKESIAEQKLPELGTNVSSKKEKISAVVDASEKEESRKELFSLESVSTADQQSVKQEKSHCTERHKLNSNIKGDFNLRILFREKNISKATSRMQTPIQANKETSLVYGKKERNHDWLQKYKRDDVMYEEAAESTQLDNHAVELESDLKRNSKKRKLSKIQKRKRNRDQRVLEHDSLRGECGEALKNRNGGTELTDDMVSSGILNGNNAAKATRKRDHKKKKAAHSVITVSQREDLQTDENRETVKSGTQEGTNDFRCRRKKKKKKKKKKTNKLRKRQQEGVLIGMQGLEDVQQNSAEVENNSKIDNPASAEVNIGVSENVLEEEDISKHSNHKNLKTENCSLEKRRKSSAPSRSKKKKQKNKRKQEISAVESVSGMVRLSNTQHNKREVENPGTKLNIEDDKNLLTKKENKLKNVSPVILEVGLSVCKNGSRHESSNQKNLETNSCILNGSSNSSSNSLQGRKISKTKKHKGKEKQEHAVTSLEINKKERKRFSSCSSLEDFQLNKRKRMSEKLSLKKDLLKGVDVREKKAKENSGEELQTKNEKEEEMFSNTEDDRPPVPLLNEVVERALKASSAMKSGNKSKCRNSFLDLVEDDLTIRKKEKRKESGSSSQFSLQSSPSFFRRLNSPPKGFIDSSCEKLPRKKTKKSHTPVSLVTKRTKSANVCNAKQDLSLQEKELFDLGNKGISALLMDDSLWE